MNKVILSVIVLVTFQVQGLTAIQCYNCQYTQNPTLVYYDCVTNPYNATLATIVNCTTQCRDQVQINSDNSVFFAWRGCSSPADVEGCTGDPAVRETCIYLCDDADLCNDENRDPPPMTTTTTTPFTGSTTIWTQVPGTYSCYSCTYSDPQPDKSCLDNPSQAPNPIAPCPPTYVCNIFRQWDKALSVVRSFSRGCVINNPPLQNNCVEDTYFFTYNSYCGTELCNTGNGINNSPCTGPNPPDPNPDTGKATSITQRWINTLSIVVVGLLCSSNQLLLGLG